MASFRPDPNILKKHPNAITQQQIEERSRFVGTLLGAAAGEALGAPHEFKSASELRLVPREITGGGIWAAGEPTDDIELTLALLRSIVARRRLDIDDVAQGYLEWFSGNPRDVGALTRAAKYDARLSRIYVRHVRYQPYYPARPPIACVEPFHGEDVIAQVFGYLDGPLPLLDEILVTTANEHSADGFSVHGLLSLRVSRCGCSHPTETVSHRQASRRHRCRPASGPSPTPTIGPPASSSWRRTEPNGIELATFV